MTPSHVSTDGAAAAYLLAASEGAFLGTTLTLVATQEFSMYVGAGALLGLFGGILFAKRYVDANE